MLTAIVVGGSFFGDNMSFISDTTIAATSTQGCKLSDKFKVNAFLAIPAAVFILVVYLIYGQSVSSDYVPKDINYIKIIPYIIVLITAIIGVNVMVVLTIGILLTGIIGISLGSFDVFGWMKSMSDGMLGMGELIIITMMAGGMLELIKHNGGIDYLINNICRKINGKRGAETSIAILIGLVNVCTANNTVAIITVGSIAKKISDKYSLDARKVASILDTMSCCVQGMIPYGAQVLIAAGLASVSPVSIIPYLYYPMCIGLFTFLAILFRYPRRYSR
jgi:Na+/H+ antiporter NhaC